ncbi:U1 small nuclear ribonucleoprotein C [Apiospora saccharicola]|uniref:U1 small nuclear ribonucleoprotein C n=1 Tax=Apiospora saccharicola TaxID=335842 RepID=A0ABR1WDT8_9PEZI
MPKFFCDYCDVYLTHDSMSVRKAHNSGRNHLRNVVDYYQQIGHEKAQSVIDSITSSYAAEGQAHANPMLPQNQPHAAHHHMSHHGAPGSGPPPLPGMPPGAGAPGFPMPPRVPEACPSLCPPVCRLCPVCLAAPRHRWAALVALECLVTPPGGRGMPPFPGGLPFPPPGGLPFPPPGGAGAPPFPFPGMPPPGQFPTPPGAPPFNPPGQQGPPGR